MSGYTGSKAQTGLGATLSIGSTPTLIGEVTSIKQSGAKWETTDVTNLQSGAKEKIATIFDCGTWELSGNRVSSDAGQTALDTAYTSGAVTSFVLQYPKTSGQATSGDKVTFSGIVTERSYEIDATKAIKFSAKIEVTNMWTETAGS